MKWFKRDRDEVEGNGKQDLKILEDSKFRASKSSNEIEKET